jgi:hypothetical protein
MGDIEKGLLVAVLCCSSLTCSGYGANIWSDGFENGLGLWSFENPSGDLTVSLGTSTGYSSIQGTIWPTQGIQMVQIYKENGGLAYVMSKPIRTIPGEAVQIDMAVGGLGDLDNCGFRWNKYGYVDGETLVWVGDNFRNVNPLQPVSFGFTATGNSAKILLGLDRACRDGLGHSAFFDDVQVSANRMAGDANLDRKVSFNDYLILEANFGKSGMWTDGDFTGDRWVRFKDYLALEANFGHSVPEPATLGLIALTALVLRRR